MSDKEYMVIEIVDVLRRQKAGDKISAIARSTGMDRKTARKYIRIAEEMGLGSECMNIEEVAYAVFREIHGNDSGGDVNTRDNILLPHKESIAEWLEHENLTLTKVHMKLLRSGVETSYSSLYRFVQEHIGMLGNRGTVRMAETEPGEVAEVDFGRLGYLFDKITNRMRALYALVVTLLFSRYQYVHSTRALSFSLIDVFRLERIIKQALGKEAEKGGEQRGIVVPARFGRPAEYFKQNKEEQRTLWE